jgi:endonuclease/exonuclease/phosphatase family metal-dependent hydrolase
MTSRPAGLPLALAAAVLAASFPSAAAAQSTLRVVAYNIRHGAGMDLEVDLERIADALRALDADVITLQEVDRATERTGGVDQTARLAELLGMRGSFGAHRPYQGGEYGNAVLTRLPLLEARTHSIPPSGGSALAVHEVRVAAGPRGEPVSVVSVHLAGAPEERLVQADSVRSYFARADHPVILAGDFNGRPGDVAVERLRRDWLILDKQGERFTFPADAPDREIDFVMLRPAEAFEIVEHRVAGERVAADHRPVVAVLRIW